MKKVLIFLLFALLVSMVGFFAWQTFRRPRENFRAQPVSFERPSKPANIPSLLTGNPVNPQQATKPVLAIMIENSPEARPQSGLESADIIYETLAEGGITRFMALYQSNEAVVVGPVRSARSYFVELAREYDAYYAHVGGSADAIRLIKQYGLHDLDQFYLDQPYWRDPERREARGLEHSMYTSTIDLRGHIRKDQVFDNFEGWKFSEDMNFKNAKPAEEVIVDFSFPIFAVRWEYDPVGKFYKRFVGGTAHKDAQSGRQLTASNILIQYVDVKAALNGATGDYSAVQLGLIGEGEGILLRDGSAIQLRWKKEKSGEYTKFYDLDGNELALRPGVAWIELAEKGRVTVGSR